MSTAINLNIEGLTESPIVATSPRVTLKKLATLLDQMASGELPQTGVSLKATTAAVRASGTVVFAGAATAADTVTINGQALTATQHNATGTAAFSTIVADNSVTIAGVTFTAKVSPSGLFQFALGANDDAAATNFAAKVNAYFGNITGIGQVSFSTIVAGNSITVGGYTFTARASPNDTGLEFALGSSDTTAATNFAAAVNAWPALKNTVRASSAAGVTTLTAVGGTLGSAITLTKSGNPVTVSGSTLFGSLTASVASATTTFRAVTGGTAGNAITLTKSGSPISVSGATLANGAAVGNNEWDPGKTAAQAATALAAAINASSTAAVSGTVTASASSATVTVSARTPGRAGNVTLTKSGSNISVSGATLASGALGTTTTFTF